MGLHKLDSVSPFSFNDESPLNQTEASDRSTPFVIYFPALRISIMYLAWVLLASNLINVGNAAGLVFAISFAVSTIAQNGAIVDDGFDFQNRTVKARYS